MNILLIHYRFSLTGGPERYMFNIIKELETRGHSVFVFSINWNDNIYSEYAVYWPNIALTEGEFSYKKKINSTKELIKSIKLLTNSVFNTNTKKTIEVILEKYHFDVAYVLKFIGKLSPSILLSLKKHNIPIVHRISDFALVCNNGKLHDGKRICDKCRSTFLFGLTKNCNRSLILSFSYFIVNSSFYLFRFHKLIDVYIIPSRFTYNIYKNRKSFRNSNLIVLPTFVNGLRLPVNSSIVVTRYKSNVLLYWGRVSQEKGILELINLFYEFRSINQDYYLKIVGLGSDEYSKEVVELIKKLNIEQYVETADFSTDFDTYKTALNAKAFIFPSLIYDNLPQSIIESLSFSLPVIASDLGSVKELVKNNYNGLTFDPTNKYSFFEALNKLASISYQVYNELSLNSFNFYSNKFNKNHHCNQLIDIFNLAIKNKITK